MRLINVDISQISTLTKKVRALSTLPFYLYPLTLINEVSR